MAMRPSGNDKKQQLFMRECLMQVYWEWRDAEDTEAEKDDPGNRFGFSLSPKAERWQLLESCIARINCEVFRGLR